MTLQKKTDRPIRVGIFDNVQRADQAVRRLLNAGITREQLGVLCSERVKEAHFPEMQTAQAPGAPPAAIPVGGAVGAAVGGLALFGTSLLAGGLPLVGAGAVLVGGGAIAGSFTGAMATLGYDRRIADRYEEALRQGKILVAVEIHDEEHVRLLPKAEEILRESGGDILEVEVHL